ncbi:MAG TPA: zinc-dependent alcohol dehydrogenase family protein [Ohtaekwangia sp.]|uniref:zinc-dependent alcohol dehydrogenase family protein n=1 Tax=Ohtaekwangia sp. TaxID=2066019 RepID=UPI002F926B3A
MKTSSTSTMRAMVLEAFDSPLVMREVSKPVPGKSQVLIKIMASGVNPLDLKIRAGKADLAKVTLPSIPGIDAAGIVEAVGENVTAFKPGDEVYGMMGGVGNNQGTLAEYIAVDAEALALKPRNLSMKEAAALPLIFVTAWEGLVDRARVSMGKKVLIHGGSGGVGHIAVQIAIALGAEVYATDSAKGIDYLTSLGATAIDYTKNTPEQYLQQYTDSEGFDVVFDTVGGETLDASFRSVRNYHGHVVSALGWGTHSIAPLSFRGATYSGIFTLLPLLTGIGKAHHAEILGHATELIEAGKINPRVNPENFILEQANKAHEVLQNKAGVGKVVVTI